MSEGDVDPGVGHEDAAITDDHGVDGDRGDETDDEETDDREGGEPTGVGDDREKYVEVLARSGERTEHFESYLRHTTEAFLVSTDDSFPADRTTRYAKADLLRVEITQHHSLCFITTATMGNGETLDSLRTFRDDVLRSTPPGRALVGVYYRLSPPIARTLSRHPTARTTRLVRRLVTRSGTLARRRSDASSRGYRGVLALALVVIYVLGVSCALAGHLLIRLRESVVGTASVGSDA